MRMQDLIRNHTYYDIDRQELIRFRNACLTDPDFAIVEPANEIQRGLRHLVHLSDISFPPENTIKEIPIVSDHRGLPSGVVKMNSSDLSPNFVLSPSFIQKDGKLELVEFSMMPLPKDSHIVVVSNSANIKVEVEPKKINNAIMSLDTKED